MYALTNFVFKTATSTLQLSYLWAMVGLIAILPLVSRFVGRFGKSVELVEASTSRNYSLEH